MMKNGSTAVSIIPKGKVNRESRLWVSSVNLTVKIHWDLPEVYKRSVVRDGRQLQCLVR